MTKESSALINHGLWRTLRATMSIGVIIDSAITMTSASISGQHQPQPQPQHSDSMTPNSKNNRSQQHCLLGDGENILEPSHVHIHPLGNVHIEKYLFAFQHVHNKKHRNKRFPEKNNYVSTPAFCKYGKMWLFIDNSVDELVAFYFVFNSFSYKNSIEKMLHIALFFSLQFCRLSLHEGKNQFF